MKIDVFEGFEMSNLLNLRGIVLKETPVGEADKFITILAKDYGKISVSVKGARRVRSGLTAGTSLFSYSDFYISEVKKKFYLNQTEPIETFYGLRKSLDCLAYGSYFLEITNKMLYENMPANNVLLLLLKALTALSKSNVSKRLISAIFELKILEFNGYRPETENCVSCGEKAESNFYMTDEGTVCSKCLSKQEFYVALDETLLYTIRFIFFSDLNKLFSFNVSPKTLKNLSNLSRHLMRSHFNFNLKSFDFIREIEEFQ